MSNKTADKKKFFEEHIKSLPAHPILMLRWALLYKEQHKITNVRELCSDLWNIGLRKNMTPGPIRVPLHPDYEGDQAGVFLLYPNQSTRLFEIEDLINRLRARARHEGFTFNAPSMVATSWRHEFLEGVHEQDLS